MLDTLLPTTHRRVRFGYVDQTLLQDILIWRRRTRKRFPKMVGSRLVILVNGMQMAKLRLLIAKRTWSRLLMESTLLWKRYNTSSLIQNFVNMKFSLSLFTVL